MGAQEAAEVERLRAALASLVAVADTIIPDGGDPQGDAERIADVMIAAGVWLPPADATLTEGRMISPADSPFAGAMIEGYDDTVRVWLDGQDVTEAYTAWTREMPGILLRTYEWPEPPPTCPECAAGKHRVCSDLAEAYDGEPTACRCEHEEES